MAYLREKCDQLDNALLKWIEAIKAPYSELNRDACIQRFEYSFELFWKVIKVFLKEVEKLDCTSPRSCFRELKPILKLSEQTVELCLAMAEDRNLSVHTYSEKFITKLYTKMDDYWNLTNNIFAKIKSQI